MAWTEAQLKAIETKGKTVLVSAAAGSGKTTTLTERIIRRLTDESEPCDISRFLIVTFTKAAAADLKSKISAAVSEALAKDPSNKHLSKQIIKLGSADICTIDSFYYGVVKKNFELLGLPARLSMMDEGERTALQSRIMESVIDDFYEAKKEAFYTFMDCFVDSRGRTDAAEHLIELYNKLSGYPLFLDFIIQNAEALEKEAEMPFFETRAGRETAAEFIGFADHAVKILSDALELFSGEDRIEAGYSPAFAYERDHYAQMKTLVEAGDYNGACSAHERFSPLPLARITKAGEIYTPYKNMRSDFKDEYKKLASDIFCYSEEIISADIKRSAEFCRTLYEVLSEFHRRFSEEKLSRSVCDFTDNKRFALRLFIGEDGEPTPLAKEYADKYDEIYIDEYQDTDLVQDSIFAAISKGKNRFMVGDIKQSIYRFRGANPSVFAMYKNSFPDVDNAGDGDSCAIYMSENFRCDKTVIDATNKLCGHIFKNSPNSIGYKENDELRFGKQIKPEDREMKRTSLKIIRAYTKTALDKMNDDEREANEGEGKELEARAIVWEISRLLQDKNEMIEDHGTLRPIRPSDIAVLTKTNSSADMLAKALSDAKIPCSARTTVNYFENPEVLLIMSLLNVIDNPAKDVFLAGVLRSPLFGFGMGELIKIRRPKEGSTLYDDVIFASENSSSEKIREKSKHFLSKLKLYREKARLLSVEKLLRFIYSDTLILSYAGGDEENEEASMSERRANLLLLYDYARRYEAGSYKGLYSFINYIDDIIQSGQTVEPPADGETEDVVSVMTVHNSKGLEFPVCFIASIQKGFSGKKRKNPIEFDYELGIGVKFGDESGFCGVDNVVRHAIATRNKREELEEEIRVLYVAMTRARERLYLYGYTSSDKLDQTSEINAKYCDEYTVMHMSSYLSWIMTAYYSLPEGERNCVLDIERFEPMDISPLADIAYKGEKSECGKENDAELEEQILKTFSERFSFKYAYDHLSRIPAKLSVSKLYPRILDIADEEAEEVVLYEKPPFLLPKKERATAAERGTATHTFMQFCSFEYAEGQGAENEAARLAEKGFISREASELIHFDQVDRFFKSKFYGEIKTVLQNGGKIYREQRFNIEMPAEDFSEDTDFIEKIKGETVTVQGVIDLILVYPDGRITLCDYKTDQLTEYEMKDPSLAEKKLLLRHGQQLSYYSIAVNRIFGKEPDSTVVYSLPLGEALTMDIKNLQKKP